MGGPVQFVLQARLFKRTVSVDDVRPNLGRDIMEPDCNSFLAAQRGALRQAMKAPERETLVTIVDDRAFDIRGMACILREWPSVELHTVIQKKDEEIIVPKNTGVLLLDQNMDGVLGSHLVSRLRMYSYFGVIASTTSEEKKPEGIRHHFRNKTRMTYELGVMYEFVNFMNEMLIEAKKPISNFVP